MLGCRPGSPRSVTTLGGRETCSLMFSGMCVLKLNQVITTRFMFWIVLGIWRLSNAMAGARAERRGLRLLRRLLRSESLPQYLAF